MAKRNEIFSIRTILPVGLGIAIGLAAGAAALAYAPASKFATPSPVVASELPEAKPLSSSPGIRFGKVSSSSGVRCYALENSVEAGSVCAE